MNQHAVTIGRSVEGRGIVAEVRGEGGPGSTLLIGGMHGDEIATIELLKRFRPGHAVGGVAILPLANPDGCDRRTRYNARGVDLNRNCGFNWHAESEEPPGPGPWSEPESRALRDFIERWQPAKIVSLHWALAEIDADGEQSTALAEAMWAALDEAEQKPYRLRVTQLGHGLRMLQRMYVLCPGSLGQWCGYALEYADGSRPAMITLELPYDPELSRPDELPADHLQTLHARWTQDAEGYLRTAAPAVEKMLHAACTFHR
jgi:hypothetical protein